MTESVKFWCGVHAREVFTAKKEGDMQHFTHGKSRSVKCCVPLLRLALELMVDRY